MNVISADSHAVEVIGEMFEAHPMEARKKITYDNAKTLYGI